MIVHDTGEVDGLGHLLSGPRARDAFLLRMVMEPPWSVLIKDDPALTLVAVAQGSLWLTGELGDAVELKPGDVMVAQGGPAYTIADHPSTPPQITVLKGNQCVDPDGHLVAQSMSLGVRTWGNHPDGGTVLLLGTWDAQAEAGRPLLGSLPQLLVRRREEWDTTLIDLLALEVVRDEPGQEVVLDRLLDLMLVTAVRSWLTEQKVAPGLAAHDPVVDHTLRLLHHNPAHGWTVASLAHEAGVSRAALARRFADVVGEPPMTYLTGWRLALAADLLAATDLGMEQIAREVGYGSPFALSAAFKRVRGMPPQKHRRLARA